MVILGLLVETPQTLYDLNQSFSRSVSLFYSASYGSLKYALDKLLSKQYIYFQEVSDTLRPKKVYTITSKGAEALFDWLSQDFSDGKLEVASLSRVFLLGLIEETDERKRIVERLVSKHQAALDQLRRVQQAVTRVPVSPENRQNRHFKLKTLEYGIGSYQFAIEWYQSLLSEMEEKTQ